jgi:hypothetical protein
MCDKSIFWSSNGQISGARSPKQNTFCTLAHNSCVSSVCHMPHVTLLALGFVRELQDFSKCCASLNKKTEGWLDWIDHILRRNCLLQQVIEGKIKGQIEVTRRRERRRKKLLDDFKDRKGYCHLKEEALDRTMWRNCFGRVFGPVVWQITDDDDDDDDDTYIYIFVCVCMHFISSFKYYVFNAWG